MAQAMAETRLKPKLSTRYPEPALEIKTELRSDTNTETMYEVYSSLLRCGGRTEPRE